MCSHGPMSRIRASPVPEWIACLHQMLMRRCLQSWQKYDTIMLTITCCNTPGYCCVPQAVCRFLEHMTGWMLDQPDRLSHGGIDRNFHSVNNMLSTCSMFLIGAGSAEDSHEQVSSRMLDRC
jgi:hypothetical protein